MKKLLGFIGFVLVVGTIYGGNWKTLADWSSSELVGYNLFTIVAIIGGGILVYESLKRRT